MGTKLKGCPSNLSGRVALVTAGSRGLGAEIVYQLAVAGADVAFTYVRDKAAAQQLVNRIEQLGRRGLALRADAKLFGRARQVVMKVRAELGSLHLLVCNAASVRSAPIWKMTEEEWDAVIETTLKGTFNYAAAVAPGFVAQKHGKIVCIGSINGLRGRMGTLSYNVAKAGLLGFVKTAASELGRYNVNVNLVAPGFIETPSQANTAELIRDLVLDECAIKRLGSPGDIAPVVVFLCSDLARHITGQAIKVDAGQYL